MGVSINVRTVFINRRSTGHLHWSVWADRNHLWWLWSFIYSPGHLALMSLGRHRPVSLFGGGVAGEQGNVVVFNIFFVVRGG